MANPKYSRYYTYIEPVANNPVVKSYAPYIFSLISIAIFGVFAIKPTVGTISDLQAEVSNKSQLLAQLQAKATSLNTAKVNMDQNVTPDKRDKINEALPLSPSVTSLVAKIQSTAPKISSSSALQIQPVTLYDQTASSSASTSLEHIGFVLNTQGSFNDLSSTIQSLSKISRLVKITDLSISNNQQNGLSLSISGESYYLK